MCLKKMETHFFEALSSAHASLLVCIHEIISTKLLLGYYKSFLQCNIHIFNISISSLTTTNNCTALFLHIDGDIYLFSY